MSLCPSFSYLYIYIYIYSVSMQVPTRHSRACVAGLASHIDIQRIYHLIIIAIIYSSNWSQGISCIYMYISLIHDLSPFYSYLKIPLQYLVGRWNNKSILVRFFHPLPYTETNMFLVVNQVVGVLALLRIASVLGSYYDGVRNQHLVLLISYHIVLLS